METTLTKKILRQVPALIVAMWLIFGVGTWLNSDTKARFLLVEFIFNGAVVGSILAAAYFTGEKIRGFFKDECEGIERILISLGLGLGADAMVLFALGSAGLIYSFSIVLMIGLPLIFSIPRMRAFFEGRPWERLSGGLTLSRMEWTVAICMALMWAAVLPASLGPELFYDSLYYHDAFGALYIVCHKMQIFPYAVHSAMPLNIDILYTMPLSFANAESVRLLHILFYIGTCLWVFVLGRRYFGRPAGLAGSMLWGTIPGVTWMAGLGAVDMGVTFFILGAMTVLLSWVFGEKDRGALLVSAVFLGLAVGSKYTALMAGAVCAVGVTAGAFAKGGASSPRKAIMAIILYGAVSVAVAAPWYARTWAVTGDPLYPALSKNGTLGAHARQSLRNDSQGLYPLSRSFGELPMAVWKNSSKFGAGSMLGMGVLAFIPALLWGLWRRGAALWMSIAVFALYLLWSRSILIVRYLYPALALGAALAGGMMAGEGSGRWKKALAGIFLLLVAFSSMRLLFMFYESPGAQGNLLGYLGSSVSRDDYLAKFAPHSRAARFVRENTPANAKLLFIGETRAYYFDRNYMPVSAYDRHPLEDWVKVAANEAHLRDMLLKKGFTHIVFNGYEWNRLNKGYGYLVLDEKGKGLLQSMLGGLKMIYNDKMIQVYQL